MDPSACRVIYIDSRFTSERWISREGLSSPQGTISTAEFEQLPPDLQANINAFLSVFNQVYVCRFGRSFSAKLGEIHENVKLDCTPILACFDVGSESKSNGLSDHRMKKITSGDGSPTASPGLLRRELTFSSEHDDSYGLQLLSRISADLQVDEGVKLIIPVAIVQPQRKDSDDNALTHRQQQDPLAHSLALAEASPDSINPDMMLKCLDAGALDVVKGPLDKAGIMGLTVHAYRIFKTAQAEQKQFMANVRRGRKQSWVGLDEEQPYSYLREAMVRKLLKGICEPEKAIEDFQHRDAYIEPSREEIVKIAVGRWDFSGQDFTEDELVYAAYFILQHALTMPEVAQWKQSKAELLRFMQGCRVAYNSFVLYHNFKHAVDVLQSTFYFLIQIGVLPPYPVGSAPAKHAVDKSPIANLLGPFEALTLIVSAIGHDVGHPGVNNMFLVKLNAPLAQLYNDQSVLESFHCAAYSQILRRHWPTIFRDKAMRKLMISSILATDMGCHADYMQQLGNLQAKIHESGTTESWTPKEIEQFRVLTCGLLIKCADISNVARPWAVAEKWTYKLQEEFAHQGEMEENIGMETTLFGGPPEIGNMLKLANGQIGFMTIFAHPLFANVTDVIPAMGFAAEEILTNKAVWFTRAEHEKKRKQLEKQGGIGDGGVSPRSQSPTGRPRRADLPASPLREKLQAHHERSKLASPQSPSPSMTEVQGLVSPELQSEARPSPFGFDGPADMIATDSAKRDTHQLSNGTSDHDDGSTTPRQRVMSTEDLPEHQDGHGMHDKARDESVSMRAGAEKLPVDLMNSAPGTTTDSSSTTAPDLKGFTFATSNIDEPVRRYDPDVASSVTTSGPRASAPMADLGHRKEALSLAANGDSKLTSNSDPEAIEEVIASSSLPCERTVTSSTKTSAPPTTDQNPNTAGSPPAADRHRATPSPIDGGLLKQSYSINSNSTTDTTGSKQKIRTAVVSSNGDPTCDDQLSGDRKLGMKSVGRKRSKLKMSRLAFWKKSNPDGTPTVTDDQMS